MIIDNVSISFPRLGIVKFHVIGKPWDYVELDRQRAALLVRWLRAQTAHKTSTNEGK